MSDLISRSALLEKIGTDSYSSIDPYDQRGKIFKMVATFPSVDARPVRRGRWELGLDTACDCEFIKCSVCSEEFFDGENDTVDILYNYCPNCGAKMDAEVE